MPTPPAARATNLVLYLAFAATGIGIALPGALLPVLLVRWSMDDAMAGTLLFLLFIGGTCGALLSRGSLNLSIVRGCLAVTLGAVALGLSSRITAFAAILLYGIGQGIVMTSVSLLQSRRYPEARTAWIARLNLIWSIAAVAGPWIVLRSTAHWGIHAALDGLAAIFALTACLTLALVRHETAQATQATSTKSYRWAAPALLLLIVPLSTGIESSAGGWLAAYSKRSGQTFGAAIGVTTCFWAGMLLSRLLQSQRGLAARLDRITFLLNPWLLVLAMAAILGSHHEPLMLAGALLLGIGVGPIYPQMLSRVLSYGEGGNTVFILAGMGASLLPLLTGLVSNWANSLRAGLIVPLAGAITMGFAALIFQRREAHQHLSE